MLCCPHQIGQIIHFIWTESSGVVVDRLRASTCNESTGNDNNSTTAHPMIRCSQSMFLHHILHPNVYVLLAPHNTHTDIFALARHEVHGSHVWDITAIRHTQTHTFFLLVNCYFYHHQSLQLFNQTEGVQTRSRKECTQTRMVRLIESSKKKNNNNSHQDNKKRSQE